DQPRFSLGLLQQQAGRHVLPVLRRGDPLPPRAGRLGMPQLPPGVLRDVPRPALGPARRLGGDM
ncbi:MAG: hypothetical protein AVDCRST_MAG34-2267, partial [uncultured Nocardioidaceae bacterium]